MTHPQANERFTKNERLRKQDQFARVYASKVFAADDTLVITGIANDSQQSRIGLSVSRKVGNAVVRNRWKRLIREAFRRQKTKIPGGLDLVIRPRKGSGCDAKKIRRSLVNLSKRIERKLRQK